MAFFLQPRIVKQYTNTDTGAVTEVPVTKVRQVISAETAKKVRGLMESVVTDGSGKHAAVQGYSIGGKQEHLSQFIHKKIMDMLLLMQQSLLLKTLKLLYY